MDKQQSKKVGFSAVYLLVAILLAALFQQLIFRPMVIRWTEVPYSRFLEQLKAGEIAEVTLTEDPSSTPAAGTPPPRRRDGPTTSCAWTIPI